MPKFMFPYITYTPIFSWEVIAIMVPVAVVTLSEHIEESFEQLFIVSEFVIAGDVASAETYDRLGHFTTIEGTLNKSIS